jgi:hypothetical protein
MDPDPDSGEGGKRNKTYEFGSGTPEQYFRNKLKNGICLFDGWIM